MMNQIKVVLILLAFIELAKSQNLHNKKKLTEINSITFKKDEITVVG